MINLHNYEEYFLLYVDNELSPAQAEEVERLAAEHPALAEELALLQATRLPAEDMPMMDKSSLLAGAMKANLVDEDLLLYLDGELPAPAAATVAGRLANDADYAAQYAALCKAKLDPTDTVVCPEKERLYRRSAPVVAFRPWMRAAAVLLLLAGGYALWQNQSEPSAGTEVVRTASPSSTAVPQTTPQQTTPSERTVQPTLQQDIASSSSKRTSVPVRQVKQKLMGEPFALPSSITNQTSVVKAPEAPLPLQRPVAVETARLAAPTTTDVALNKIVARTDVTSSDVARTTIEDATETAGSDGEDRNQKRHSAKGLFRKVSRFIGRNTGIGIASTDKDNEVLIGALALRRQ